MSRSSDSDLLILEQCFKVDLETHSTAQRNVFLWNFPRLDHVWIFRHTIFSHLILGVFRFFSDNNWVLIWCKILEQLLKVDLEMYRSTAWFPFTIIERVPAKRYAMVSKSTEFHALLVGKNAVNES